MNTADAATTMPRTGTTYLPTKSIPWHLMSLGTEDTIKSKNLDTLSANSVVKNSRASVVVTSTAHGSVPSSS